MRIVRAIFVASFLFFLVGCGPLEKVARDVIATAHGPLIESQAKYHDQCVADSAPVPCQIIKRGVALNNSAIDALNAYCAGPTWDSGNGECTPHAELSYKLSEATGQLNNIIPDLKGLLR